MNTRPAAFVELPGLLAVCLLSLQRVEERGLDWRRTRFGRYMELVGEIAASQHPRIVDRTNAYERDRDRRFREALTQLGQLSASSRIWDRQDPAVLKGKLRTIMSGPEMPPPGVKLDAGRNALLELAAGGLLARHGFEPQLTSDREDLVATAPEFPGIAFAIELKRPASRKAVESNLKQVSRQLEERCRDTSRTGIAVFGIDRLTEFSGSVVHARDYAELEGSVRAGLKRQLSTLHRLAQRKDLRLFPKTPFVAAVLFATVTLEDVGMPVFIGILGMHSTARSDELDLERVVAMRSQLARFEALDSTVWWTP